MKDLVTRPDPPKTHSDTDWRETALIVAVAVSIGLAVLMLFVLVIMQFVGRGGSPLG